MDKIKFCFLIFILLTFMSVSLPACSGSSTENLVYGEADSGTEVIVSLNDSFELTLEATGSYYWYEACTIDNESVVKQLDYEYQPLASAILVAGTQVWTFKAVGTGTATISNIYGGIHGNSNSFSLSVVVK